MNRKTLSTLAVCILFATSQQLRAADLLAYFDFNDDSNPAEAVEQSGNAPNAALAGPAAFSADAAGVTGSAGDRALDLGGAGNGAAAVVPAGSHFDAAFNNNAMSVSLWQFNTQIANSSTFWVHSPPAGANDRGFQAHIPWGNGTVFFDQSGCCGGPQRLTAGGVVIVNQWQHFVFQRDAAGNREIWVDGVLAASAGGAEALDAFNGIMTIGAEGNNLNNGFSGRVDDVAVFSDTLTPDEIANLASGAMNPAALAGSLRVDFNSTTQDGGPHNEPTFQPYDAAHEVSASFVMRNYNTTFPHTGSATVSVTPTGPTPPTTAYARRSTAAQATTITGWATTSTYSPTGSAPTRAPEMAETATSMGQTARRPG